MHQRSFLARAHAHVEQDVTVCTLTRVFSWWLLQHLKNARCAAHANIIHVLCCSIQLIAMYNISVLHAHYVNTPRNDVAAAMRRNICKTKCVLKAVRMCPFSAKILLVRVRAAAVLLCVHNKSAHTHTHTAWEMLWHRYMLYSIRSLRDRANRFGSHEFIIMRAPLQKQSTGRVYIISFTFTGAESIHASSVCVCNLYMRSHVIVHV